jgi:hypothetical protein
MNIAKKRRYNGTQSSVDPQADGRPNGRPNNFHQPAVMLQIY